MKLNAFAVRSRISYKTKEGEKKLFTDISMAIAHSPTLCNVTGLSPGEILDKAEIRRIGGGRIIEYPGSDKLKVSETITSYEYENPIPEWLGWIIGVAVVFVLENLVEFWGLSSIIPTWIFWLCIFLPLGIGWERIFSDKIYHLVEIFARGEKENVIKFARELRNNLGRDPIWVLSDKDLARFSSISGISIDMLDESWRLIEGTH